MGDRDTERGEGRQERWQGSELRLGSVTPALAMAARVRNPQRLWPRVWRWGQTMASRPFLPFRLWNLGTVSTLCGVEGGSVRGAGQPPSAGMEGGGEQRPQ